MFKKVLLAALLATMHVHAVQEFAPVIKTPVAETLKWLCSGSRLANVAVGVVAVCVLKSGFDIIFSPVRLWCNARDARKSQEASAKREAAFGAVAKRVVTLNEEVLATTGSLSSNVDHFAVTVNVLAERVTHNDAAILDISEHAKVLSSRFEEMAEQLVVLSSQTTRQIEELNGRFAKIKIDNPLQFGQKLTDLSGSFDRLQAQLTVLQESVSAKTENGAALQ